MRNKPFVFLSLVLLILMSFQFYPRVKSFDFAFDPDEEFIWNCNVCDELKLKQVFGNDWNSKGVFKNMTQDSMMKWKVISQVKNQDYLNITVQTWKWRDNGTWGTYDNIKEYYYLQNPNHYPNNFNFSKDLPYIRFWIPIPMSEYVNELNLSHIYDIDSRVLFTINIQIPKDDISAGIPSQSVNLMVIYNQNGMLHSLKVYLPGNLVLIDISLLFLPFYTVPLVIGLFVALIGATIFYFLKIRKNRDD